MEAEGPRQPEAAPIVSSEAPQANVGISGHGAISPGRAAAAALSRHNNFDLVRLVAASQVVVYHTTLLLDIPLPHAVRYVLNALPGVPIFFVTSGFLLAGSLERDSDLVRYGWNRILRIYPALWVCFGVTLILLGGFGILTRATLLSAHGVGWVAGQLVFAKSNPAQVRQWGTGTPNGSLWTISVEIGFYVVLGALWLVIRRLRRRAGVLLLAGVAGASLLLAAVTGTGQDPTAVSTKLLGSSPFPYLWVFLIGSVARLCWPYVRWAVAGRAWLWTPLAILGYHVIPGAGNPSGIGWLGQFAGLLLLGLMAISWAFTATRTADRLLRGIDISYGVYLYHFLWINTAIQEGWARNWATAGLIAVITFGCALSSWFAIELPALRLKNRVPTRRATAVAQGEPSPMGDAEAAAARK